MLGIIRAILDLRTSLKLGITSVLGLCLAAGMVFNQVQSDATVRLVNQRANNQRTIVRDMIDVKASLRGMQIGVRDLRLAAAPEDIKRASDYLDAREKSANRYLDESLGLIQRAEIRSQAARLKVLIADYSAGARQIASVRSEAIALGSSGQAERVTALNEEARNIARQRTLPIASELEKSVNMIIDAAKARADEETAEFEYELLRAEHRAIALAVAMSVLLIGTFMFLMFALANPMRALNVAMLRLADGDFAVSLPGLGRKDEVGDIAGAVERFKVVAAEKAQRDADDKAAQDRAAAEQRRSAMNRLASEFESAVGTIIQTVSSASTELEAAAGTLTKTAEGTQLLTTRVASASEEASTNVQSVASATEEMASSVNEIGRQVQESARIASDAVGQARQTDERINSLSNAASRIGDVVELINTIAGQTNLLALNATIEAARAGEAGKGFAVVASEVKALAEQTAKATSDISQQVSSIQAATSESVVAIKEIGKTIIRISEISSTIASAVEEQGAATQEISRNVQQAAVGTTQVASSIAEVERGASETGSASSQVLIAATELSGESNRLRLEVGKFLDTVRAA